MEFFDRFNAGHHRREWSAAEFPSVCMAMLAQKSLWQTEFTVATGLSENNYP
jgi:hypothetical protein